MQQFHADELDNVVEATKSCQFADGRMVVKLKRGRAAISFVAVLLRKHVPFVLLCLHSTRKIQSHETGACAPIDQNSAAHK